MKNFYPIVIIPDSIVEIKENSIPLPKEPNKFQTSNTGWYIILISIFVTFVLPPLGIVGIIVGLLFSYSDRKDAKEYQEKVKTYFHEKSVVINKRNNLNEVKKYKTQKMKETLAKTVRAEIHYKNVKGRTELYFLDILNKYFNGRIETDKVIELFTKSKPYSPDYILVNESNNLHINIEIDEPYVSGIKKAIHYVEEQNSDLNSDRKRNHYFTEKGWIVIRFAEEQVLKYPDDCCKFIIEVCNIIEQVHSSVNNIVNINYPPKIKCWTANEAEKMFDNDYRNIYLLEKIQSDKIKLSKEIYDIGMSLFKTKNYKEACDKFSDTIKLSFGHELSYYYRGLCYYHIGNYTKSIQDINKCIELNKNDAINYKLKGDILVKLNSFEEAITCYDNAISVKKDYTQAYYSKYICCKYLNKTEKAKENLTECLRIDPNNYLYYNQRGILNHNIGYYELAIEDFSKALSFNKDNKVILNNRGFTRYHVGDFENAVEDFREALMCDPSNSFATKYIALINTQLENETKLASNYFFSIAQMYYKLGMNVTCITNIQNEYNKYAKNIYKNPNHTWKKMFNTRQNYIELLSYKWNEAVGVGTVTGFNHVMAIDIDDCVDSQLLNQIINTLGLSISYEWVMRSGSNKGFHIVVRSEKFQTLTVTDVVSTFGPSEQFKDKFSKVELLWNTHLVCPPSLHVTGNKYQFINSKFPISIPEFVPQNLIEKLVDTYLLLEEVGQGSIYS